MHVAAGATDPRRSRRQVDDRATASSVDRRHAQDRFARAQQRACDIRREQAHDFVLVERVDAPLSSAHSRVVDEHVDATEVTVDQFEHVNNVDFLCNVCWHDERTPARSADLDGDLFRTREVASARNAHVVTALCSQFGDRRAESARATGDDANLCGHWGLLLRCRILLHECTGSAVVNCFFLMHQSYSGLARGLLCNRRDP